MNKKLVIGTIVLGLVLIVTLFPKFLAPYDPLMLDMEHTLEGPTMLHLMGTDRLGRDMLSRIIMATQVTCIVAFLIVTIGFVVGVIIGSISGFLGGIVDNTIMRFVDILMAFPSYIFTIALAGMLGPSVENIVLAMSATSWIGFARMSRSLVMNLKSKEYMVSTKALGAGKAYIIFHHILPHVLFSMITYASVMIGGIILSIVGLSYLGLGVTPPAPELGAMLNEANHFISDAPHMFIFPGLMIIIIVMGFQMLGDGLQALGAPKQRRK